MKTADFFLNITFSHYGAKKLIPKVLGTEKFTIEVSEFEDTENEYHSGIYSVKIKVTEKKNLIETLKKYIKKNNLIGECFTLSTENGIVLFTEVEFNDIN